MKKSRKRFLFLIIFSMILMPYYVKADENVEAYIHPPVVGESMQEIIWGSGSFNTNISFELYNNTDNVVVLNNTKIKKNKDYTLSVRLSTLDNEEWNTDTIVSIQRYNFTEYYVDKTDPIISNDSYEFQIHYNTSQEKKKIYNSINFDSFGKPIVGKNFVYQELIQNDTNKKHYTINQGWYEEDSNTILTESDMVEANKIYKYHVEITADEGYTFSDYINIDDYVFQQSGYYQYQENEFITNTNKKKEWIFTYNTTQQENMIYGPVELEMPIINYNTGPQRIISKDSRYTVEGDWYYYDDNYNQVFLGETDQFEVGKYYSYNFHIQPTEGYQVENDLDITMSNIQIGNNNNMYFNSYGGNSAYFSISFYDLLVYDIYNINTYEARPTIGKKPQELRVYSYANNEEAKYEIASQEWYVGSSKMGANEVFVHNRNYKLEVTYQTKGDYEFSNQIQNRNFSFPSEFFVSSNITNMTKTEITVEYLFEIKYRENYIYDSIDLNIKAPTIGAKSQLSNILSTDYSIDEQYWYNLTDHKKMISTDVFEKDKIYQYSIFLKANGDKKFSSEFIIESSNFEASPYLDKDGRIMEIDGGQGSTSGNMRMGYKKIFLVTDKIDDKDYMMGYIGVEVFTTQPKAGYHVVYGEHEYEENSINRYKELGLLVEKGWYEAGSDKILSENDIFKQNKTYELHIRYTPINGKKIISTLITDYDSDYDWYKRNPYFKEERRIDGNNYFEVVLSYEMGSTNYDEDQTIIKEIPLEGISDLEVGQKITKANPQDTNAYTITERWYQEEHYEDYYEEIVLDEDTIVEKNQHYIQEFIITPKNEYRISSDIDFHSTGTHDYSIYWHYNPKTNQYIVEVVHSTMEMIQPDPNMGFIEVTPIDCEMNNGSYVIPEGVDSFSLNVEQKSGEYDVRMNYGQEDISEPIEYEINNDVITFSNINNFRNNNQNCSNISFSIIVDANDQYSSAYNYYTISFEGVKLINKKIVTLPIVTDYEGKVDGENHSITTEGGSGGTIIYSLDEKTWQDEVPQISKKGITKVYVKINPDEGYTALMPTYGYVKLYGESVAVEVRFHSNDENNQLKKQSVIADEETKLNKNTFTREDYDFVKWTTNPDGTGDSYEDEANIEISNDLDLYAQWKSNLPSIITLTANPESIDYGEVRADFTKAITKKVIIKNTGNTNASLRIINPTSVGPFGSQNFNAGKVLRPNEEYQVTLILNPNGTNHNKPGTYNGNYQIIGTDVNDNENSYTLEIPAQVVINPLPMSVAYMTHVQDYGDQRYVRDGAMSGTSGQSKRLEAIRIKLENQPRGGDIEYRTHVEDYGWMSYVKNGAMSGTSHEAKRLEAIQIRLTGEMAEYYDVYYRVHAQDVGWMNWAKNDEMSGTAGYGRRLEGIEIVVVEKGQNPPVRNDLKTTKAFIQKQVSYTTHVQDYGWQSEVADGAMSGTSHQSKRLEGIKIKLYKPQYEGDIEYRTHVQDIGWQDFVKNGAMSGTSGQAKRLEAIEIKLTNQMETHYDIYYRVHAENFGWMGWAKNGESAGTAHYGYRLEGIEIVIVDKGEAPPIRKDNKTPQAFVDKKKPQ